MASLPRASFSQDFTKMLQAIILLKLSLAFIANGEFDELAFTFTNNDSQNLSDSYDEDGIDNWTKFNYFATNIRKRQHIEEKLEVSRSTEKPTMDSEVLRIQPGLPAQSPMNFNSDGTERQVHGGGGGQSYFLYDNKAGKSENATTNSPHSKLNEGDSYVDEETANCTNEYCISDEEYYDMIVQHILPSKSEWLLIGLHCMVFFVGLIGNALVCIAVYRNRSMRTVTNYFIVNLAVADFMVILFCLPPTLVWDVTQTWFMGTLCCKIVLYFQTVSVAVSVLTLTFISVDRWYAICFPLKFKSTTGRAKTAIIIIWMLAICFDIPELLVLETRKFDKFQNMDLIFFTQCSATWSEGHEEMFQLARILLLYTVPLLFMSIAYCQIVRVLWRSDNIPGHSETVVVHSGNGAGKSGRIVNNSTECQLRSRRKAAKMLVAVVLMFAVCYFPVHLLNMLRMTMDIKQTEVTGSLAIVSHWLCYANSAVNPVIYNFMSGKFRKEFQRAFGNMFKGKTAQPSTRNRADSTMVCRYTTMTVGSLTTPKTEIVQLSNTTTINDIEQCPDPGNTSDAVTAAALNRVVNAQNRDDIRRLNSA